MDNLEQFLQQELWGNSYGNYLITVVVILLAYILRKGVSSYITRFLYGFFKKFSQGLGEDEFKSLLVKPLRFLILLIAIYFAIVQLSFPSFLNLDKEEAARANDILHRIYGAAVAIGITWLILRVVDFVIYIMHQRALETEDTSDDQIILFLKDLIKVIVVILAVFFMLSAIFKVNITSLIAGLGIGGLAVALAAQETLSNLLGSFIIFLDKPFKQGDLVTFDNITGVVEKVGFRSSKIRTLEKSLLTVPNKNLTDGPMNNITLSPYRRVKFNVGVEYGTSSKQLKSIKTEIEEVLKNHPETWEDYKVAFSDFGAYSMDIMVLFFVHSNDWDKMVSVKEEINFKIMEIVERNGCDFAFPTQTLHISRNASAPEDQDSQKEKEDQGEDKNKGEKE